MIDDMVQLEHSNNKSCALAFRYIYIYIYIDAIIHDFSMKRMFSMNMST